MRLAIAAAAMALIFSVASYREINAFALPGGPVWVHRGAIGTPPRSAA